MSERLADAGAKGVVCADYTLRRGKRLPMLEVIHEAARDVPSLRDVIVVEREPGAGASPAPMPRCASCPRAGLVAGADDPPLWSCRPRPRP